MRRTFGNVESFTSVFSGRRDSFYQGVVEDATRAMDCHRVPPAGGPLHATLLVRLVFLADVEERISRRSVFRVIYAQVVLQLCHGVAYRWQVRQDVSIFLGRVIRYDGVARTRRPFQVFAGYHGVGLVCRVCDSVSSAAAGSDFRFQVVRYVLRVFRALTSHTNVSPK